MGVFEDARAVVLLADYIGIDGGGKINALGTGFTITAPAGPGGTTAPQFVAAIIDVPAKYAGQDFAMGLELRDDSTGQVVQVPTSPDPSAPNQPMRIQQVAKIDRPNVPGVVLPGDFFCRAQAL